MLLRKSTKRIPDAVAVLNTFGQLKRNSALEVPHRSPSLPDKWRIYCVLASLLHHMLMRPVIHENNSFPRVWRKLRKPRPLARPLDDKHSSVFTRRGEISGDEQARPASGSAHLAPLLLPSSVCAGSTGKRKFRLFSSTRRSHHGLEVPSCPAGAYEPVNQRPRMSPPSCECVGGPQLIGVSSHTDASQACSRLLRPDCPMVAERNVPGRREV